MIAARYTSCALSRYEELEPPRAMEAAQGAFCLFTVRDMRLPRVSARQKRNKMMCQVLSTHHSRATWFGTGGYGGRSRSQQQGFWCVPTTRVRRTFDSLSGIKVIDVSEPSQSVAVCTSECCCICATRLRKTKFLDADAREHSLQG